MRPGQPAKSRESRQPKPGRERGHDAASIKHANRREIEEIEKVGRPGERDQKGIIKGETECVARGRGQRTEDRTANSDARFHPGIARCLLKGNEGAHKRNEHRRAHGQAEFLRDQQMSTLVQKQKQDKPGSPFPTPDAGVNANHQNHGPACFEQNWQDKLDLADEFQDDDADHAYWTERFFYLASGRFAWRRSARLSWIGNHCHTGNIGSRYCNSPKARPRFVSTSRGKSDCWLSPWLNIEISAARPQAHAPTRAASKAERFWASKAEHTPVRTSPMPPVAIPGFPVVL